MIRERIKTLGRSRKGGLLVLSFALLATLLWMQFAGGAVGLPIGGRSGGMHILPAIHPSTGVRLQATLSQPMVVQGGDNLVYLDLSVVTPGNVPTDVRRIPSDIIVVLDRSGSMGEGNKWAFATQAVHSLFDRLYSSDRIALITFESSARLESGLIWTGEDNAQRLRTIVDRLRPGGSTNMGAALLWAERIAKGAASMERRRRVVLLSDGHANTGIVEPEQLGGVTRRIADAGSVVSTVGMGLGFNETLMASLADQGMGGFSYLEDLESLGKILAQELSDSRQLYADGSEIRLDLPSGVDLIDAAGYPFVREGGTSVIRTGQLFRDSTKRFMATLRVANHQPAEYSIGSIDLVYRVNGRSIQQQIPSGRLQVACVPPERKEEVVASIDKDLYQEAWLRNNFGLMMRKLGDLVRSGEREKAKDLLGSYRQQLDEADRTAPGVKKDAEGELKELEERLDDAFRGRDQDVKQNRAAKALLDSSQKLQREVKKNQH